jgi:hypothetical protein
MRGTKQLKVKGKLTPRYISPFQIQDRKEEVAYQLEPSLQLYTMCVTPLVLL